MARKISDLDPSRGLLKFGLRLPIWLYRLHLGWLLGNRFLMLTHIGRISGRPHQTVLEVVDYDGQSNTYVIASGWGEKSSWFKNITKNNQVLVTTRNGRFEATANRLSVEETRQTLIDYSHKYPLAFRELAVLMSSTKGVSVEQNCDILAQTIPLFSLKPNHEQ
jgi:deazaflavin-dependent oxidoreductase (nitroreductase family)